MERSRALVIDVPLPALRRALLLVAASLAAASVLAQLVKYQLDLDARGATNLFDANQEQNLPTMYSVLLLVTVSLLSVAIGASSNAGRQGRRYWFALTGLFALGAIDETAGLHEQLNDPVRSWLGTSGPLSFPWVVAGALAAAAIALVFRRFVGRLRPPVRRLAVLGALLFASGALGVEMLENALTDPRDLTPTLASSLVGTVSEAFEMSGLVLIVEALLLHIALNRGPVSVVIRPAG